MNPGLVDSKSIAFAKASGCPPLYQRQMAYGRPSLLLASYFGTHIWLRLDRSLRFSQFFSIFFPFRLVNLFCYIFRVTNFSAISNLLFSLTSELFILVIVLSNYRISTLFYFIASILHWYSVFIESSSPYFPWSL